MTVHLGHGLSLKRLVWRCCYPFGHTRAQGRSQLICCVYARQAAAYQAALIALFIGTLGAVVFLLPLFVLVGVVTAFRARSGQTVSYPIIRRFVGRARVDPHVIVCVVLALCMVYASLRGM